jgi:hypothetical protein
LRDVEIHNARLNDCDSILYIDGDDAIHPLKLNDDTAFNRQRSTAQSRSGAPWQKRNAIFIRKTNDLCHLSRSTGKDHNVGLTFEERQTIAFVDEELRLIFNDSRWFQNLPKLTNDFLVHATFVAP